MDTESVVFYFYSSIDLGWSCVSIGASKSLFDLLIFHEDNDYVETLDCAPNVIKINLHKHGLAALTASSVTKHETGTETYKTLRGHLEVVFAEMPYLLAQFKIAVLWVKPFYFPFIVDIWIINSLETHLEITLRITHTGPTLTRKFYFDF